MKPCKHVIASFLIIMGLNSAPLAASFDGQSITLPAGTVASPFTSFAEACYASGEGSYYFDVNGNTVTAFVNGNGEVLVASDVIPNAANGTPISDGYSGDLP